ncbi:transporter substrate-binding domain-containing protein [Marinobacter sp. M3C]|jgi:branched-chain amino acid transport system substrate-binding protein|uniref:transporter substrate-binding domain-containing protein n=1 Tax=Marinobacter sp. M3C TaxID=2917715 RepID=UPI00200DE077|nr:transporter substrate-binding domain-containing protein [Marinobacter sp. M3C]UQG60918.1 transporter substrate-binding domain-containing protein [Marinobacter sp. M3C]
MKSQIPIGLLFSTAGPYGTVGQAMRDGALLALEEVNLDHKFNFVLIPHQYNPKGDIQAYIDHAQDLLRNKGVKHVIGCYTSSSRKELIPIFEKYDSLLWYPSHYEGFETNNNVIYTGAVQNHHVLPLMNYVLAHIARDVYFIGSNYVWAWENGRIVRELTQASGGNIVAERYLQITDLDVNYLIDEIRAKRPSFIMNMLIGESSYAFYRAFAEARDEDEQLRGITIGSCSLCEPELTLIGPKACAGHLSSSVYFSTIDSAINRRFVRAFRDHFGHHALPSADAEASYNAVHLLAHALADAASADVEVVKKALYATSFDGPQGLVHVDPENNHCYLTPRIGISRVDGTFSIVSEFPEPVRPDPYLILTDTTNAGRIDPEPSVVKRSVELRLVQ